MAYIWQLLFQVQMAYICVTFFIALICDDLHWNSSVIFQMAYMAHNSVNIHSINQNHTFIHSFIRSTSAKNKKAAKKKTPVKKKLMKNAAAPTTKVVRNLTDILNDGQ
jgi:hypothetical protein